MGLKIAGTGPGNAEEMTARARHAIENADVVVGYTLYNELLKKEFPEKKYFATPMRREKERCMYALESAARGEETVLVCSGDGGVYGMASLVFELAEGMENVPDIEVIPGVTAALSGGAVLGSPLTNDFAVISLSDLLTQWDTIEKRLKCAAEGDLVIVLYNPGSAKRRDHLRRACDIIMRYRSDRTVCGVVRNIGREGEASEVMTLGELRGYEADMFTTVFVGNTLTRSIGGRMVTPRGYKVAVRGKSERAARVIVFGGTTEGRLLAEGAAEEGLNVILCVATEYGEEVLDAAEGIDVRTGRLSEEEIEALIEDTVPAVVFDATHPYAAGVTRSVSAAAAAAGVRYVRLRRYMGGPEAAQESQEVRGEAAEGLAETTARSGAAPGGRQKSACGAPAAAANAAAEKNGGSGARGEEAAASIIYVPDINAAADLLDKTAARAFITTGSRGAAVWGGVSHAAERLTLRILPSGESLELCRSAGFKGKNLICMQGPFSTEVNEAMFRAADAEILVTKASGRTGGFPEKLEAARRLGMHVIVITPPGDIPGVSLNEAAALCAALAGKRTAQQQ